MSADGETPSSTNDLGSSLPAAAFALPPQPAPFRMLLVSLLSAAIGLAAGVVAFALYKLIGLFTNLFFFHRWSADFSSAQHNHLGWMVIVTPVVGGLIVGIMAKYGTSKIKGHGIPEAMEAVLVNRSRIEPSVAILKPISAAIAIGTGGPFGAEGPIIQTGGALGSLVGQAFHTTAVERKVLLACGAAAGMSATFNTPIAGVILAIELLLFEFKSRSFIPLVIASTLATAVHMQLLGVGPMFQVSAMNFAIPRALPFYLVLGLICGLAAVGFSKLLYWVEDQFEKLPIDEMWWPAIGALGLGVIGFFVPRVLGVGYDTIGDILNGQLVWKILLVVMIAKAVALVVSLGSGTSGGLLAPCFMWSAAMGGIFAMVANHFFPAANLSPGSICAGRHGSGVRRGVAGHLLFHHFRLRDHARLQLRAAADVGQRHRRRHRHALHAQHFDHDRKACPPRAARPPGLRNRRASQTTVGETMEKELPVIPAVTRVSSLAERIARHDPAVARHEALLILDEAGQLCGIITRGDILRALDKDSSGAMTVLEAGSTHLVVAHPDELVSEAAAKMLRFDIGRLPVVERSDERKAVGYLGRAGIMAARFRRFQDEHVRDTGWLRKPAWLER